MKATLSAGAIRDVARISKRHAPTFVGITGTALSIAETNRTSLPPACARPIRQQAKRRILTESATRLASALDKIDHMVSTSKEIGLISRQAIILAFNAAIEADRAGSRIQLSGMQLMQLWVNLLVAPALGALEQILFNPGHIQQP